MESIVKFIAPFWLDKVSAGWGKGNAIYVLPSRAVHGVDYVVAIHHVNPVLANPHMDPEVIQLRQVWVWYRFG